MKKIRSAKNTDELIALAKECGFSMSPDMADKCLAELNKVGILSDEELGNVSGGCGGGVLDFDDDNTYIIVDDTYETIYELRCNTCGKVIYKSRRDMPVRVLTPELMEMIKNNDPAANTYRFYCENCGVETDFTVVRYR